MFIGEMERGIPLLRFSMSTDPIASCTRRACRSTWLPIMPGNPVRLAVTFTQLDEILTLKRNPVLHTLILSGYLPPSLPGDGFLPSLHPAPLYTVARKDRDRVEKGKRDIAVLMQKLDRLGLTSMLDEPDTPPMTDDSSSPASQRASAL